MNRTTKLTLPHASPGTRIVYLFLFFLGGLFVSGLFLILLSSVSGLESGGRAAIYTGTILQSVVAFIIPSYLAVRMGEKNVWSYFKLKRDTGMTQKMALGVSAFIVSYVCVSFLNQWNQSIVLPESLRAIENWMRSLEDSAMQTTHLLLSGETILHLILNLVIIAALAALSEEIFFRGALQQFLQEKYRNGHVAVWISSLIFSVIHFQFYGFFPRLVLGALLGYLFLYTRNLWIPILVHFINNATVIVLSHFWKDTEWMHNVEEMEVTVYFATAAAMSAAFTILLFHNYKKRSTREASKIDAQQRFSG